MPTVGVFACIFNENNQVLCVKRNYGPKNWTTPGGRMDPCESVHEALVREVREETGFLIEPGELVGVYSLPERDDVVLALTAKVTGREPWRPTQEITEVKFFDVDDLPSPMSDRARARILEAAKGVRGIVQTLPVSASEAGSLEKGSIEFRRILQRIEGSIQLFRDLFRYLPEEKVGVQVGRCSDNTIAMQLIRVSNFRSEGLSSLRKRGVSKSLENFTSLKAIENELEVSADSLLTFLQESDLLTEAQLQVLLKLLELELRCQGVLAFLLEELGIARPPSWNLFAIGRS